MKKNYFFGKVVAGMAILFGVLIGFVSCGQVDNPLEEIINTETPIVAEVLSQTDDGATIKVYVPSDITKLISEQLKGDITAAALNGETYTVTIDASGLTVNSSDNTITIPKIAGSDIVLQFENDFSANVPLVIKASSASDEPVAAINEMTIETPDGATGIELDIQMPETTVTITGGAVIENLVSFTAISTLVIENGVTVKFLQVKGGRVKVEEGAVVETYVLSVNNDNPQRVRSEPVLDANNTPIGSGILAETAARNEDGEIQIIQDGEDAGQPEFTWEVYTPEYNEAGEEIDRKPYLIENLKVIKGDDVAMLPLYAPNQDVELALEKLTIAAGASVDIMQWSRAKIIEGEGSSPVKVYVLGYVNHNQIAGGETETEDDDVYEDVLNTGIQALEFKNVELSASTYPDFEGDYDKSDIQIVGNAENCIINGDNISIGGTVNAYTFKNCTFKNDGGTINFIVEAQTDDRTSLTGTFESCIFSGTSNFVMSEYHSWVEGNMVPYNNFIVKYIFKDCKHGNNSMTETYTGMFNYNTEDPYNQGRTYGTPEGVSVLFNFGASDYILYNRYVISQTDANKKWAFIEAEAE